MTDLGPAGQPVDASMEALQREGMEVKARSQWQLFRRRFLRHKLAMTSLVVLVIICGAAIFADQIAPYAFDEVTRSEDVFAGAVAFTVDRDTKRSFIDLEDLAYRDAISFESHY
jgi:ABC-type antimicrobial peptide transport system permease subunit